MLKFVWAQRSSLRENVTYLRVKWSGWALDLKVPIFDGKLWTKQSAGSNKQFIGVEASEDCDADDCGDLWEGNPKRGVLLTVDKIIVAWDWVNVMPKL